MKRALIVTLLASTVSLAAYAQDPAPKPDPGAANSPTEKMEPAAPPTMAPDAATQPAPTVGESPPPPKSPDEKQAGPAAQPAPGAATFTATEAEAKNWVGKAVYSSDNKKIGSIAEIQRGGGDDVSGIEFDNGGFLGFGATRYRVPASDVQQVQADSLVLKVTEAEVQNLAKVEK